ncbi:MAG: glycosyltransferase family 4 protein [Acidimicrobiales bacterium]
MRAVLDATALGSGLGGDETMLRGLLRGLALTAEPGDELRVLAAPGEELPAEVGASAAMSVERLRRLPGPLHFGARLPWRLARHDRDADVVFSVTHAPVRSPIPRALMVQDLSFHHRPDLYPRLTRHRLERLVRRQVHEAAVVMTVSDFCRDDIIATYGLAPDRVHTVPNTVSVPAPLDPTARAAAEAWLAERGLRAPYFLYLGNLHPRKNVATALRAFTRARATDPALADHRFVVAGARWWGEGESAAAEGAPAGSVLLVGRVDDDVRRLLLERAEALVYLSMFEGFGLPPLEAMAAGTPVIASTAAAIPEVTGGAALLRDPLDLRAIASAMSTVVSDEALRRDLVRLGHERVTHYDPIRTGTCARRALRAATLEEMPA